MGAVTLVYGLLTSRISRSWVVADWLINYSGGFVRRGLLGEVALLLGRLLHVSPVVFAVVFYLAPYVVFLLAVRALARAAAPTWWVVALLLSPATLSFQVLDATAGFRKEVIFLAALAALMAVLERRSLSPIAVSASLTAVLLVTVLSHESLICYTPYLFAALLVAGRTLAQACRQFALPFVAAAAAAYECARHLGGPAVAASICQSLGYTLRPQGSEICTGGAIAYLTFSSQMARQDTQAIIHNTPYYSVYAVPLLLALIPLLAGARALARGGFGRELQWIAAGVALAVPGSLVLFIYATDWGRWIYIHAVSIAVLLLVVEGRRVRENGQADVPASALVPSRRLALRAVLAAYATLWTLPHVPMLTPRFGYIGLARYVLSYRQNHAHLHATHPAQSRPRAESSTKTTGA